jgi:hypothetical protein
MASLPQNAHRTGRLIMATSAVDGMMLLMKKLGGIAFVLLGCLGVGVGFGTDSMGLTAVGVVALAVGIILLMLKVVRRNPD